MKAMREVAETKILADTYNGRGDYYPTKVNLTLYETMTGERVLGVWSSQTGNGFDVNIPVEEIMRLLGESNSEEKNKKNHPSHH